MKPETFLNAVGMIDDRFLDVTVHKPRIKQHKWKKALISVAAAVVLIVAPLPTLTAFGVDSAYYLLYAIIPSVAQTFKPVQKSCTDNGIEMTVISAERKGNEASVYIAMHDVENKYPGGKWDLFDSYGINVSRDMIGHCSFSEYDSNTHTAYFVVHLETMDGSEMPDSKVTFSVGNLLMGKVNTNGLIKEIDLSTVPYEPETTTRTEFRGMSFYDDEPYPDNYRFLLPAEEPLCTPVSGVSVWNIGYVDGALHILTEYDDILTTDNHGFMTLRDESGNAVSDKDIVEFSYWDDENRDSFSEIIIPIDYENLSNYSLYGEFVTSDTCIFGDWEVTFPLQ